MTPGIRPAVLMGMARGPAPVQRQTPSSSSPSRNRPGQPVTMDSYTAAPAPTVEVIRGDKRATEVIK